MVLHDSGNVPSKKFFFMSRKDNYMAAVCKLSVGMPHIHTQYASSTTRMVGRTLFIKAFELLAMMLDFQIHKHNLPG